MRTFYRFLRRFAAVILGLVFFVAGHLKLVDPLGSRLIVESYLQEFHLYFLWGGAEVIGVALALLETLLGAALMAGVWRGAVALVTSAMMLFYTALTVVLALRNSEFDCGCFGEAIHLTATQSMLKNIVLCALCAIAFLPVKGWMGRARKAKYVAFGIVGAGIIALCILAQTNLPPVDFMSYAPGKELYDPEDEYAVLKNGREANFISLEDTFAEYSSDLLLRGRVMLITVHTPGAMDEKDWKFVRNAICYTQDSGFRPMLVLPMGTAPLPVPELAEWTYFAEQRTLYAINRSNGGLTWIEDGEFIHKWAAHRTGTKEKLDAVLTTPDPQDMMVSDNTRGRVRLGATVLAGIAILLLL